MAESNKILDVTYGNFSCRLEGFDDSVETMKVVVGYFHDLAGHDLFTDQAASVPDLDTLARLAEDQTSGNVAIESDENGVSLRVMTDENEAAAPAQADDAPEMGDAPDMMVAETDDAAEMAATYEEPAEVETAVEDAEAHDDTPEVATYEEAIAEDDLIEETPVEEAAFEAEPTATDDILIDAEEDASIDDVAMDAPTDDDVAAQREPDSDVDTDEAEEVEAVAERETIDAAETSAADRLQRIRAVVGRGAPPARDDTYAEDLSEEDVVQEAPKAANPLAQRLAELAKRNSELMEADARLAAPTTANDAPLALTEEELVAEDVEDAPEPAEDFAAAVEEPAHDEDDVAGHAQDDQGVTEDEAPEIAAEAVDDAPQDIDDTPAQDVAAERVDQPLLLTTRHQPITADDHDDDDDDFDLHEEVAKIEREIAARPGNELARHGLPRTVEDAMSRILMKTDLQLDLQETRDGRDAIAQLKAAVAATEAARQLGDAGAKSRDVSAMFRDDLGALEGTDSAGGSALPPLKLVEPVNEAPQSSLREVAPLTEAAARLREIAETTKAKSNDAAGLTFADFAQQQGARDLVDKLEAAGAYLAFVEGENDFSRPQVMKVVQSATEAEVTREDGLRSFGRLLRQSRIIKLNNGRFQIAENTRFRPSTNQAARY